MTTKSFKRRRKLIKPALQLRLTGIFLGLSLLCMLLQILMFGLTLSDTANALPTGNAALHEAIPGMLVRVFLISVSIFLPLITLVGITTTFRVAGPVYRFETFLRSVAAGEETEPCRIRKADQLHDLCDVINEVTEPLRAKNESSSDERQAA